MSLEIVERMTNELTTLAPSTMKIKDELPDGEIITVETNVSVASKCCSSQGLLTKRPYGIHDTSFQNVMKCDVDTRKEMYAMSCCKLARHCSKGFLRA